MLEQKRKVKKIPEKIVGKRFSSPAKVKEWIRKEMEDELPNLVIEGLSPFYDKNSGFDYFMECCLDSSFTDGSTDFTLFYLLDNNKDMYVTEIDY